MPSANGHSSGRAVGYYRVSGEEQAKKGYSLPDQRDAVRSWCAQNGCEVVEEVEDDGWSGAYLERPGLDRVRELVEDGAVDAVVVLFRDRLARGIHAQLLKAEFEERGARLVALNHQTDDSPEGELQGGILDQFAAYERLKIAERTRRGLLRKARSGKVIKGPKPNYGFRFDETGEQLVVHEPEMRIVERIFRVAAEGMGPKSIQTRLYAEGIPSPTGKKMWSHRIIKVQILLNDLYRPHTYEEIAELVSPEVAARLDREQNYGIWWFNRRNVRKRPASEPDGTGGRRYRTRLSTRTRERSDWIAVPVPASDHLPRELVDQARYLVETREGKERIHPSREWELKGVMRCSCGQTMLTHTTHARTARPYHYCRCKRETAYGPDACPQKGIRIERVEPLIWDFISGMLKDPDRLRAGLEEMIEQEHARLYDNPEREREAWLARLAATDKKRSGFQDMAAEGLITLDELRTKLTALDEVRETAGRQLAALDSHRERLKELERDREAVIRSYASMVPGALDGLTG